MSDSVLHSLPSFDTLILQQKIEYPIVSINKWPLIRILKKHTNSSHSVLPYCSVGAPPLRAQDHPWKRTIKIPKHTNCIHYYITNQQQWIKSRISFNSFVKSWMASSRWKRRRYVSNSNSSKQGIMTTTS